MDFTRQFEVANQALIDDVLRRLDSALQPFAAALDDFLAVLFSGRLPANWRQQWRQFVAKQAAAGFTVVPESARELEDWIEAWARYCELLPVGESYGANSRFGSGNGLEARRVGVTEAWASGAAAAHAGDLDPNMNGEEQGHSFLLSHRDREQKRFVKLSKTDDDKSSDTPGPFVVSVGRDIPPDPEAGPVTKSSSPSGRRGDQSAFSEQAVDRVAAATGASPNRSGPRQQTIPGSGRGGFRLLDFLHRGPDGSIRLRGTIIEVKASTGTKFGDLSGRSRKQILDAVEFVVTLRSKVNLVKDPTFKALLRNARVEVFSDLPKPITGQFAALIRDKLLEWKPIPQPISPPPASPVAIGKSSLGAAENLALGFVIAFVEADVADSAYRESVTVLDDLLRQIAHNGEADENNWREIEEKLKEIAKLKQSTLGSAWGFVSIGQGSLIAKQAVAMMMLAWELADKYGYKNKKTWGELFTGGQGHFEKKP
jgi:hypothetical protein